MTTRKFPKAAAKYMRGAAQAPVNCPACDGSGWTVEGWAHASRPENRESFDWRKGDCVTCGGTGAVDPVTITVKTHSVRAEECGGNKPLCAACRAAIAASDAERKGR